MKFKVSYDVGELATVGAGYQMSSEAKTHLNWSDGIQAIEAVDSNGIKSI